MRENPQLRRMIVEEAIAQSSSEIRFAHTLSEVLKDQSGSALLVTARDAADFHVNPEPSSLLVWTAMGISLLAAGYAYRRRVENETSTFATA